jgi:trimeric autotransporter adhesin
MQRRSGFAIVLVALAAFTLAVDAQSPTPPPAPILLDPPSGAALVQPITLRWSAVNDPDGPIGSYTWQLGTTSSFTSIVASGFTDVSQSDPAPTQARLSGVPSGSYFWRVRASQSVGGATGAIDSAWSAARGITVTGLGPAPGTPQITAPANASRFHERVRFRIDWTPVAGAHYYLLEADDEPSFSFPHTLSMTPMKFGTTFVAGWGNALTAYYRVRAVSVDNVMGLPSPVVSVQVTNAAPVPAGPQPLSPAGGATVSLPFKFDWTDVANPQIPGYDIDVDDEPTFGGEFGVLLVQNISRSDYTLLSDRASMTDLAPGNYFWRVRAIHGEVVGPWSAGVPFTVVAAPPTPPGLDLFWFVLQPSSVSGGHPTQGRVTLNGPAPAGGAVVRIASDLPHSEVPESVFIPAGATDAVVSPVTSTPVIGATIGRVRAGYGGGWEQNSIGMWPILFSLALNTDSAIGGNSVTGTITLQEPAPAGGVEVTLVSEDTSLVRPPAKVMVAEGAFGATFPIATSTVSASTRVVIHSGTEDDGYEAPEAWLTLRPAGSAASAPTLASVTLRASTIVGGATTTGTVTLNGPAPEGGAAVWVNGSMEGQVVTSPLGGVTVPAGSRSADFTITGPHVNFTNWILIQASYGSGANGMHAALLQVDPGPPGPAEVFAIGIDPMSVTSGQTVRGTVGLAQPAPVGGATVFLSSSDPAARVPASVNIPAGNSANSFTITTSSVINATSANIVAATSGSDTIKSAWLTIFPDPNADVVLLSVTPSVSGTTGGNSIPATLFLNGNSPPGGAVVTLTSSNPAAAQVPSSVSIPGGQGWANFTITTSPVATETSVTITGNYRTTQSTVITVLPGPKNTGLRGPAANAIDSGGDGNGFQTSAGNAHGDDSANAVDTDSGTVSSTSCTSTGRDRHRYFNYGLALANDATVSGIEVRLDSRVDNTSGSPRMCVELSWDGGVSWTGPLTSATLSTTMTSRTLGGPANTWGRSWSPTDLSDENFRVRLTNVANSTVRDFTLDWVAVRVTYQGGSSEPPPPPPTDTTTPSVSITSPAGGASVSGTTTISASASDNVGVTRVEFFIDGALLSSDTTSPYSASWNTTSATNAAHSLTARAFDAANNQTTSAAVSVTVSNTAPPPDTTMPSVSITGPTGGATVSGTTTISASASDNVGVTRVEFFVDGVLVASDASSPYSASWNTTTVANASHSLTARAFDAANNQTLSGAVSVTVNNAAPPPPTGTATLTVTATGRSGERVTSNPAGINVSVGATGSASFNAGTSITLSVTNGRDAIWSGACSSGGNKVKTCTFTLNANATVTANVQ